MQVVSTDMFAKLLRMCYHDGVIKRIAVTLLHSVPF